MSANPETHTCWKCGYTWKHGQHGGHSCSDRLLEALDASRKENEALRAELARRSDAGRVEVPELTAEDLGGLLLFGPGDEDAEWGDLPLNTPASAKEINKWFRSRLSPSPQPATGAVIRGVTHMGILPKDSRPGDLYWERGAWREWRANGPMANASSFAWIRPFPSSQPSADVVVVPRGSLESVVINIQRTPKIGDAYDSLVDALRSSPQPSADVVVSREEWEAYRELEDAAESALDEVENHGECDMTGISDAYKMVQDARANHDAQDAGA